MPGDLIFTDYLTVFKTTAKCTVCQQEEATLGLLGVTADGRTERLCQTCQARIILLGVDLLREQMAKEAP